MTINSVTDVKFDSATINFTKTDSQSTAYYRINGGSSILVTGSSFTIVGLTHSTTYTVEMRSSADPVDVWSATTNITTAVAGTLNIGPLSNNTGSIMAMVTGVVVDVCNVTTGALIVRYDNIITNHLGMVRLQDSILVSGTTYRVIISHSSSVGIVEIAAS